MSPIKVMIVEDEIITAIGLFKWLQKRDYEVCDLISSGEEALSTAEKARPDIIIMDINLRGGINGIEAGKLIKNRFCIPIIYLTGYFDEQIIKASGISYSYEYLIKPVEFVDIISAMELVLKKKKEFKRAL